MKWDAENMERCLFNATIPDINEIKSAEKACILCGAKKVESVVCYLLNPEFNHEVQH